MANAIYLRKSRQDDEAETMGIDTLERHEKTLLGLAKKQNLSIIAIYREIVSGETISARPQMQRLLSDIENGKFEGVLVMEVERLARGDTIDQGLVAQAFKYSNTKIITPNKTYNPNNESDEEYFEFGLFMSRREYKTINKRLQAGRICSIKEGKYVGNKPPFGYERVKLKNEKGFKLQIIESQAEIVRTIFKMFTKDGFGTTNIATYLNSIGLQTSQENIWKTQAIVTILRNPVYYGKIKWGARKEVKKVSNGVVVKSRPRAKADEVYLFDGMHESIINEETYILAKEKLALTPNRGIRTGETIKNPLVGLVRCGVCGEKMQRRNYQNRPTDTLLCQNNLCSNVSSDLYRVEDEIIENLKTYLKKYKANFKNTKSTVADDKKYQTLLINQQSELEKTRQQFSKLCDFLEQGIYSKEVFLQRNNILTEKTNSINKQIDDLRSKIQEINTAKNVKIDIIPKITNVLKNYNTDLSAQERNELLKTVVDKIVYVKTKGGRWGDPNDFSVVVEVKT